MKNMNYPRAGEQHRRAGRQAALQDWPVGCTLRGAGGLHIKLGCGKGRAGGLPFSAARPAVFRSPPPRLFVQPTSLPFCLVFCAARQPADSSRFSFGNMALKPARLASPPISVILIGWVAWMSCSQPDAWCHGMKLNSKRCEQVTVLLAVYNHY